MHNYHVCFATIPLDAWYVHKPTVLLFQQYRDQLSLLIHGNDHIAQELAKHYADDEQNRNLRQAIRRIDEFERRSGVEVSRVMAPPHGACSEITLGEMAKLGFEAACISRGSLRYYNGRAAWLPTLGMSPSDIIGGLPVFPRFPLSMNCQNSILIAALLNQPIIAVGHHNDLAEGLQILADLAKFANSLGTLHWADMKRISRSHYARRFDGHILRVRMYTRHISIQVPEGINQIWVERTKLQTAESMLVVWRLQHKGLEWNNSYLDKPIPVIPGQRIEIASKPPTPPSLETIDVGKLHLWPVVRRQLTEARDRVAPVLRRISIFSMKM
jgi:hypothetical protein